jgi:hypothetical protein
MSHFNVFENVSISHHFFSLAIFRNVERNTMVRSGYLEIRPQPCSSNRHLKLFEIPPDTAVCMQGDLAECYFIVYKGECEIYKAKNAQRLNRWKGLHLWVTTDEQQQKDEDVFAYDPSAEGHKAPDTRKTVRLPLRNLGPKVKKPNYFI